MPVLLVLLLAGLLALALGVMGRTTNDGAFRGAWEFSRLGGPWLVVAFAAGVVAGWRRRAGGLALGVVAGAIAIGCGSLAYYALSVLWDDAVGAEARRAVRLGVGWGAAGTVIGGVLGATGAAFVTRAGSRRGRDWLHGAAIGTLGGLLMGESIALLWVWDGVGLRAMATLEGLAGVALVVLGCVGRGWRFVVAAVLAAAVVATVAPIATTLVRETLRQIGWAGA